MYSTSGFPTLMMEVELTDVAEALANLTERGAVDPVVKATLMLSESGFVSVTEAVAFGEVKDDSLSGSVKSCLLTRRCGLLSFAFQAN